MSKIVLNLNYVPSQKYLSESKQESTYNWTWVFKSK